MTPHSKRPTAGTSPARPGGLLVRSGAALGAVIALAACGGSGRVVVIEAPINVQEVVLRAESSERLRVPQQVVFDWAMAERGGARVDGQGVARMEPPFRARLDLFLGNGEPAGAAAIVEDDLRLPTGMSPNVLPPPHLLWGALGVFRPGLGTGLLGAERDGEYMLVRYSLPGNSEAIYRLADGRIQQVEVMRDGSVVQRLTLERDELGVPVEALYRDLVEVTELKLTRTSVAQTEPFPSDIWTPFF